MSSILSNLGTLFSSVLAQIEVISAVIFGGTIGTGATAVEYSANPILILFCILPLVGIGIGMFKRLISVN